MNIRTQVRQFMQAAGQDFCDEPHLPTDDETRLRLRLICEEVLELLEACYGGIDNGELAGIESAITTLLEFEPRDLDIAEVADALADIDYVVEGMRQTMGINGPAVAREVHRTNMNKFGSGATRRRDGKWLKPPDWEPPNIRKALDNQNEPFCKTTPSQAVLRHYRGFELRIQDPELHGKQFKGRHIRLLDKILDEQDIPVDWIEITEAFIIIKTKGPGALRVYEV